MMTIRRILTAIHLRPKGLGALSLLAFLLLWACHLGPEDTGDKFDVTGDTAWVHCDTVRIILLDAEGEPVDTMFNDSLKSLNQLRSLDASKYDGGKGGVAIKGLYKDGSTCFEQNRSFESGGRKVTVDTLRDPNVAPTGLSIDPKELVLTMGSPAANIRASVVPGYANPGLIWTMDASGVAALEGLDAEGNGNPARVKPLKVGRCTVTVKSAKDASVSARVPVRVVDISTGGIELSKDTVILYEKGPTDSLTVKVPEDYAGQKVEWRTLNPEVATIDNQGRIKPIKTGQTVVQATLSPSGLSDVAVVLVKLDKPVVTVSSAAGAPVNVEIVFSPRAVQEFGTLVLYRWDFTSDGKWEDSLTTGWSGDTVDLPAVKAKYDREGNVIATFQVRDSEGNIGEAQVVLDIGNQAPIISGRRKDTVISVKDSIPMFATARDGDGKVAWVGWDYEGDGQFDDTLSANDSVVEFKRGHTYHEASTYNAVFRARDSNGKTRSDTARIKVEFDEPIADAGPDFTVTAGSPIDLKIGGADKFGSIVKREYKVGDGSFIALSAGKADTAFPAPAQPSVLRIVVRVTDDDGLSDVDTVAVTVVLSNNADLADLTFSAGPLEPGFKPNATFYAARVAFADSVVSVTPKVKDPSTRITVNGKTVASGTASETVKLALGSNNNAFQIIVTAEDGSQRVYSVSATRDPNGEATLAKLEAAGLSLSPAFSATTVDYADTVPYNVSTVTFKPTVASAGATLAFGDSSMVSGTFTSPQSLDFKENVFRFTVTAQDGKTMTTYTVRILRLGRLTVFRKLGGATPTVLDSFDLAVGTSRALSGGNYPGWQFTRWSATEGQAAIADSGANPTTVTLNSGVAKVQAAFERLRYTVDVTVTGCGKLEPGADSTYDYGAAPEYRLMPAAGCRIESVKVDGNEEPSAYDSVYTFAPLTANHTLNVKFTRTYTLTFAATGRGTVTPASVVADSGTRVVFKFKPDAGYKVAKDGVCEGAACRQPKPDSTFSVDTVRSNRSFSVTFKRAYRMTGSVAFGQGTMSPRDSLVDSASLAEWRFAPAANYRVDTLMVDGKPTGQTTPGTYVVNPLQRDVDVKVVFIRQYKLTVEVGPNGNVNRSTGMVDSNRTVDFTATGNSTYRVDSVLVDGVPVSTNSLGKFHPQNWTVGPFLRDITVRVTFKKVYFIDTKLGSGGTITPPNTWVDSGASQAFTLNLATGYRVTALNLSPGGADLMPYLSGNTLTLPSVTADGVIAGSFSNLYSITLNHNLKGLFPLLCIYVPSQDRTTCTPPSGESVSITLAHGTAFSIQAEASASCGSRICVNQYFQYWSWPRFLGTCDNPHKASVASDITYTANYGTKAPSPGVCEMPF